MEADKDKIIREKMILLSIIGCLEVVKERKMTIEEAEIYIFSPRTCSMMKNEGYSKRLIHIIELGCEIEDIESLLPEKFENIVDDIKKEAIALWTDYENNLTK